MPACPASSASSRTFLRERGRTSSPTSTPCCSPTRTATTSASPRTSGPGRRSRAHPRGRRRAGADREVAPARGQHAAVLPHRATWRLIAMAVRTGGMRTVKIAEVAPFGEGELDVPGRPRAIHTPGPLARPHGLPLRRARRADRRRRAVHLEPAHRPPGAADHAERVRVLERAGDGVAGADRADRGWGAAGGPWRSVDRAGSARPSRGRARPGRS